MANLNDILNGLVNINSKMANNINNLLDSIGEGFLDIGELTVSNGTINIKDATILVNGSNITVDFLTAGFSGNKICFLEYRQDKSIRFKVMKVVDADFNYDLSQLSTTSKHFEVARQYNGVFEDRRISSMASKDNTIVGALSGALKAIDYDDEIDLEINMDILSRISSVESDIQGLEYDIQGLESKKADKTYVDDAVANADIDIEGIVKAVDVGEVEGVENPYISKEELDEALEGFGGASENTVSIVKDNYITDANDVMNIQGIRFTKGSTSNLPSNLGDDSKWGVLKTYIDHEGDGIQEYTATFGSWNGTIFRRYIQTSHNTFGDWKYILDGESWGYSLQTNDKTIIGAINELFQYGTNVKQSLVDRLVASDPNISTNDSWDTLFTVLGEKGQDPEYILQNNQLNSNYSFYNYSGFTYNTTNGLYSSYSTTSYESLSTNQLINFDNIISIEVRARCSSSSQHTNAYCIFLSKNLESGASNVLGSNYNNSSYKSSFVSVGPDWVTQTFDVSSWKGEGYLALTRKTYSGHTFFISDITLVYKPGSGLLGSSSGGLDIISKPRLPATGVENQICCISNTPPTNYVITYDAGDLPGETSNGSTTYFLLGTSDISASITIKSGNITSKYPIQHVVQDDYLLSYYYKNNSWNLLTAPFSPVIVNGVSPSQALTVLATDDWYNTFTETCFTMAGVAYNYYVRCSSNIKVDWGLFSRVEITCRSTKNESNFILGCTNLQSMSNYSLDTASNFFSNSQYYTRVATTTKSTITLDISSIGGSYYLGIMWNPQNSSNMLEIYDIKFYK